MDKSLQSASRHTRQPMQITDVNSCRDAGLSYEEIRERFVLEVPAHYNMATDTVGRQARSGNAARTALVVARPGERVERYSYQDLDAMSDAFAAFLAKQGVGRGDVVIVYAGQGLAAAIAPLAAYKLGAINAPLSLLYGPRTIEHVIRDSRARVMVSEPGALNSLRSSGVDLSQISLLVVDCKAAAGEYSFAAALETPCHGFEPERTRAGDPALLLYTSGSTGLPKGILHAHRFLIGYFASVSLFYQLDMDRPGMVLWTPSDWSWIAGIVNVMLTGWHFGQTVVAGQGRFDPDWAFGFLASNHVTHCFLTPTALKRMTQVGSVAKRWPDLALRAIGTGGEPLPSAVLHWFDRELGLPVNEFYGLTEVNHLIGNSQILFAARPGSMGKAYPGHRIEIVDATGTPQPAGVFGEIAAHQSDPTLFLDYWGQPERTAQMRIGEWVRTGDYGIRDPDGYFWYHGRQDDLIKSAGYRIGPAEVEDALIRHPEVAEAAVIGRSDPERGQIVVAYVRVAEGAHENDDLVARLQQFVKDELATYKYPREIIFVSAFPVTSTGKISRKQLRENDQSAPAGSRLG